MILSLTSGPYESAVSMKLTPSSTAHLTTRRASLRSVGSPQMPLPVSRIVPSPSRATRKSSPISNSPLRPAVSLSGFPDASLRFRRLLLLLKYLPVGLAVGIEATVFALRPIGFQFGRRDVPIRTAFPEHNTQVLSKLLQRRSSKKPVAVVDLEHHETRFENDDMRNHRIVLRVRVLGDVEILLNLACRIG